LIWARLTGSAVLAEGREPDPGSIFRICHAKLEANFVRSYLQVVDEIPKTTSEEPQERLLLERFDTRAPGVFTEE